MTTTDDAYERLRKAADDAEAALAALEDKPLSERFEAALDVYTARRAIVAERSPRAHTAKVGEALAELFADPEPAPEPEPKPLSEHPSDPGEDPGTPPADPEHEAARRSLFG